MPKAIFDGAGRKLQPLRNLAVRTSFNMIEQENFTGHLREAVDRLLQHAFLLLSAESFLGSWKRASDRILYRARFHPLTPEQTTQMIPGQVGRDREQKAARILDRFRIRMPATRTNVSWVRSATTSRSCPARRRNVPISRS